MTPPATRRLLPTVLIHGLVLLTIFPSGCAKKDSSGAKLATAVRNGSATAAAAVALRQMQSLSLFDLLPRALSSVGTTTATGISSMKYNLTGISLCQGLTTSGSGFSNPTGCIPVYIGDPGNPAFQYTPSQNYSNLADAARQNPQSMIDLMDPSARLNLSTSTNLTSANVGSYKYGYVIWFPVTEVTADLTVGGNTLRTSDGTVTSGSSYRTTSTDNFTTLASDKQAVVVLDNGGNWFAFQNPFVISQADIDAQTAFSVDLTFNPDGLLKGYTSAISNCPTCNLQDAAGNQIAIPELSLIPVARHSTDVTMKEVYQGSVIGTSGSVTDNFDLRIELYYVQSDPQKTIYGVDIRTLPNANSNTFVYDFGKVSFLSTNSDGSLQFQNYQKSSMLDNFKRGTKVGDTVTPTIQCATPLGQGGFNFSGCGANPGDPTSKTVSLTLTAISKLQ